MRNWVRIMLISMAGGFGLATLVSIIFGVQFMSLLWIPFLVISLTGLYLALPAGYNQGVTITLGVLLIAGISWKYWHDIDTHLLRPLHDATWSIGQGHIDNQATAERNLQADKTEKMLIKGALGTDKDVTVNLYDDESVDSLTARLDKGTNNTLKLKKSLGRAAKAIMSNPLDLVNGEHNKQYVNGHDISDPYDLNLQPGQISREISLVDASTGAVYLYSVRFTEDVKIIAQGKEQLLQKNVDYGSNLLWDRKIRFQALPDKPVSVTVSLHRMRA